MHFGKSTFREEVALGVQAFMFRRKYVFYWNFIWDVFSLNFHTRFLSLYHYYLFALCNFLSIATQSVKSALISISAK